MKKKRVLVRTTINLAGLPRGAEVQVDPADPFMQACLEAGYLVPVEAPSGAKVTIQKP